MAAAGIHQLQPGLIQVVCNDLVTHLQSRPLHKGEPLIAISDSDIDAVTSDERTRKKIAEKLGLTIALEDRYRVIALTVAIMSMQDGFREKYAAGDIRINCEAGWNQGFEDLNSAQFEVYLDELIGWVCDQRPRQPVSVRSPNIVTCSAVWRSSRPNSVRTGNNSSCPMNTTRSPHAAS